MSTPHLNCHVCCTPFPPEDLSQSHGIAFCRRCQTLIRLDRYQPPRYPMTAAGFRPQVELPKGWSIQWTAQELHIVRPWFSPSSFIVLFVGLFFGRILMLWCVEIARQFPADSDLLFLKLLQVGGILLLFLFLVYLVLASFLNTTTVTVKQGYLTVVHTPLPWFQPPPLRTADITQLFVRQIIHRGGYGSRKYYEVWAQLRQGREVRLMYDLETPEQALFIEQELEMFLGITDRPVPGELERWS